MATLRDLHGNDLIVHATRIDSGGDLHKKISDGDLKIINRWVKKLND